MALFKGQLRTSNFIKVIGFSLAFFILIGQVIPNLDELIEGLIGKELIAPEVSFQSINVGLIFGILMATIALWFVSTIVARQQKTSLSRRDFITIVIVGVIMFVIWNTFISPLVPGIDSLNVFSSALQSTVIP